MKNLEKFNIQFIQTDGATTSWPSTLHIRKPLFDTTATAERPAEVRFVQTRYGHGNPIGSVRRAFDTLHGCHSTRARVVSWRGQTSSSLESSLVAEGGTTEFAR